MIIKKCNNINDINLDEKDLKVITWGKYDAMHLGHQTIMNKMMSLRGDKKAGAVIFGDPIHIQSAVADGESGVDQF